MMTDSRHNCVPAVKASAIHGLPQVLAVAAGTYSTIAVLKQECAWEMLM
jgi:hypothetical protein